MQILVELQELIIKSLSLKTVLEFIRLIDNPRETIIVFVMMTFKIIQLLGRIDRVLSFMNQIRPESIILVI